MSDELSLMQKIQALVSFLKLLGKPVGLDQLRAIFPREGWHEVELIVSEAEAGGHIARVTRMNGKGAYQEIQLLKGAE